MLILTITNRRTLKLPREVFNHLRDTRHLQVRLDPDGIILTPVDVDSATDPEATPEPSQMQFKFSATTQEY